MRAPPQSPADADWSRALEAGAAELGTPLTEAARRQLEAFVPLLLRWNRVYNLTAIEEPSEIVTRHLLDSLAVLPWLEGSRALDVGSGAGFPGIPLAIARPQMHITLLDSREKRVRFLRQAVSELGLPRVEVVLARVEQYRGVDAFDSVLARAFSSLADLVVGVGPLCAPGGVVLAMKGVYPAEELADPALAAYAAEVTRLQVPGLAAERHMVRLRAPT